MAIFLKRVFMEIKYKEENGACDCPSKREGCGKSGTGRNCASRC
jgi:hypothetical protein